MADLRYTDNNDPNDADATPPTTGLGGLFHHTWSCQDWRTWLHACIDKYGDDGRERWRQYWEDQSFWSTDYSFCKYDSDWYDDVKAQFPNESGNAIFETVQTGKTVVNDAKDVLTNVTAAISNTSSTLKWLLPVAAVVLLGIVLSKANKV